MKSYLSLVSISSKVRKSQGLMLQLCITISVFLVTTIFSVSNMYMKAENERIHDKHGYWHIKIDNIPQEVKDDVNRRFSSISAAGCAEYINLDASLPYYIEDKKAALHGVDKSYGTELTNLMEEGSFPNDNEVVLSSNSKFALDVDIGDNVIVKAPGGEKVFRISGFGSDDKEYYQGQTFLVGVYMTENSFKRIIFENNVEEKPTYFLKFCNEQKALECKNIFQKEYVLYKDNIHENVAVMAISGKSRKTSINEIYLIASFVFILVLISGILMISGSLSSNILQRMHFFGIMRCLGASRKQIMRFVRLEALSLCKFSVPVGLILGIVANAGICAYLRYCIGGEFSSMPVFAISPVGVICGIVIGVTTVIFASQTPAKKASKVSPILATTANSEYEFLNFSVKYKSNNIDCKLGFIHAISSLKKLLLIVFSYALSIIMFLCFYVGINFAKELLPNMRNYQPDLTFNGYDNKLMLNQQLVEEIKNIDGVKDVFSSAYMENIDVISTCKEINKINLVSYDEYLLKCFRERMLEGSTLDIMHDSGKAIAVSGKNNKLKTGDIINIGSNEIKISGIVSDCIFPNEPMVICSQKTFEKITQDQNYTLIGVKLNDDVETESIKKISKLATNDIVFKDCRKSNKLGKNTYVSVKIIAYCFLIIIAGITLFYMINNMLISVSIRTKQYGIMRAIGMNKRRLFKMIVSEAGVYAIGGLLIGLGFGLPINRFLYGVLITKYFGLTWNVPWLILLVIILGVLFSIVIAICLPIKRLYRIKITDAINFV